MSEFVGRTGARRVYSYPENGRASALLLFARNFATGPKVNTVVEEETLIPWNLIDALSLVFTIAAGGVTVSIAGDVTALFSNGDELEIIPTTPAAAPAVNRTISSVPAFASGFTTFDLDSPIDLVTTAGVLGSTVNVPITPRVTGVVKISGVVLLQNNTGDPSAGAEISILVDGSSINPPSSITVAPLADGQFAEVPFLAQVTLPIGVTANVSIEIESDEAILIVGESSAIELQEVAVSTG